MIEIKRAPFTFNASNTPAITIPINAKRAGPEVTVPSCTMVSPCTITPEVASPTKAMKRPIPTEIARLILAGNALIMASLTLKSVKSKKIIPYKKTAVRANSNDLPM